MSYLESALDYARSGYPVLPLAVRGKHPACPHGKDDATTDLEQITRWWTATPAANIGIRPPTGCLVLDVDPRNGGTLDALGDLPTTLTAHTGGGGWHLWFTYHGPVTGTVADAPGIDIKTERGYVVAPPSIHPSGNTYRWDTVTTIAPLPAHLVARVRKPLPAAPRPRTGSPGGGIDALCRLVAEAPEGTRNDRLFWAACRAAGEDAGPDGWDALRDAALEAGLTEREAGRTIDSARNRTGVPA